MSRPVIDMNVVQLKHRTPEPDLKIVIMGPAKSGKSNLAKALKEFLQTHKGFDVRLQDDGETAESFV